MRTTVFFFDLVWQSLEMSFFVFMEVFENPFPLYFAQSLFVFLLWLSVIYTVWRLIVLGCFFFRRSISLLPARFGRSAHTKRK